MGFQVFKEGSFAHEGSLVRPALAFSLSLSVVVKLTVSSATTACRIRMTKTVRNEEEKSRNHIQEVLKTFWYLFQRDTMWNDTRDCNASPED